MFLKEQLTRNSKNRKNKMPLRDDIGKPNWYLKMKLISLENSPSFVISIEGKIEFTVKSLFASINQSFYPLDHVSFFN